LSSSTNYSIESIKLFAKTDNGVFILEVSRKKRPNFRMPRKPKIS
jgi:hypothetical protein